MKKETTLYLPKGGKQKWTEIMKGRPDISEDIQENQPIVSASTTFDDGIMVIGGVYKSNAPKKYNVKFFYVYDAAGNLLPNLIIPSDKEDFRGYGYIFYFQEDGDAYHLHIKEKE